MESFNQNQQGSGFFLDVEGVNPAGRAVPLPEAEYLVIFNSYVERENANHSGRHMSCEFIVQSGEYDRRKIIHNFNYRHTNPQTVDICKEQMKQFVLAATEGAPIQGGISEPLLQSLLGRELVVYVKLSKDGQGNEVREFRTRDGGRVAADGSIFRVGQVTQVFVPPQAPVFTPRQQQAFVPPQQPQPPAYSAPAPQAAPTTAAPPAPVAQTAAGAVPRPWENAAPAGNQY